MIESRDALLEARNVGVVYGEPGDKSVRIEALKTVSLSVRRGETVGVVGESGSGKTTLSRVLLGIERPTDGLVLYNGTPLRDMSRELRRRYRRAVSAVFQNPFSSLDPRMRVWQLITEQQAIERKGTRGSRLAHARNLMQQVGLSPKLADEYPSSLSGGECQRVAIARALSSGPDLIVLDEATSSLDVSVRAQVANLLLDLQDEMSLTYVFIAHDLSIVQRLCHRLVVMRRGQVVEENDAASIFRNPSHEYTAALLRASYLEDL